MKVTKKNIDDLEAILGPSHVLKDPKQVQEYSKDWSKPQETFASCVLLPNHTEEISKILAYCQKHQIPVVPSGGRTGLAAGAVAKQGEVILSLGRLNKVLNVDPVGLTVEVEAGVTTQALQEAVAKESLFYAVDLGARGSSQIGGNLATNAGGLKFIRYGGTREQVLGLEVVLAGGQVLNLNRALRKNNAGYPLMYLFVGSEGTLGVITRATLKLSKKPRELTLACVGVETFPKVVDLLALSHQSNMSVTALEFFSDLAVGKVLISFSGLKLPFAERFPYYALIEIEEDLSSLSMEQFLETAFEKELIRDAVLASSSQEFRDLWALRENITESLSHGYVRKNDISLSIKDLCVFFEKVNKTLEKKDPKIEVVMFGHIGDGNVHVNYSADRLVDHDTFIKEAQLLERRIFSIVHELKGSISAEHGIGLLKKDDLKLVCEELEISYMKGIKQLFDPKGIMNPGKIFDL
ncbi:MAG: FAD-binding oxidoreductase [Deltaproteobacteria bacterium]|nr:FAD-binding oxidoreductase [Deltaproteobacteria bacterium]